LCAPPGGGPLEFSRCASSPGDPLFSCEGAWSVSLAAPAPLVFNGTLCASASGSSLAMAPCSAGADAFAFAPSTQHIVHAPSGLCVAIGDAVAGLFSNVFSDGMVLQRGAEGARLWGTTAPGTPVTVNFAGANATSLPAGPDGRWELQLPPMEGGGTPYSATAFASGGRSATLAGLVFGDVFWCTGQSNLCGATTDVAYAFNASEEEAAAARYPWVRVTQLGSNGGDWGGAAAPLRELQFPPSIAWQPASPGAVRGFSAACWYHGKTVADAVGAALPIGLVEAAWGGTALQVWAPPDAPASCGAAPPVPPACPGCGWPTAGSALWNAFAAPFNRSRVAGFVFYQGESNALTGAIEAPWYACALAHTLGALRALFRSPLAHVAVVQLHAWAHDAAFNNEVAALRDAQLRAADALPNASAVTAVDGGDPRAPKTSIHPRGKQLVGRRTGAAALSALYGVPAPFAGPRLAAWAPGGGSGACATLTFSGGGGGRLSLVAPSPTGPLANSSVCPDGVAPALCAGFSVLGSDGVWRSASASVAAAGDALVLQAEGAPAGVVAAGVASGWAMWPITLLYGSNGLPAFPFNATATGAR
jgi:hypothetical protein